MVNECSIIIPFLMDMYEINAKLIVSKKHVEEYSRDKLS